MKKIIAIIIIAAFAATGIVYAATTTTKKTVKAKTSVQSTKAKKAVKPAAKLAVKPTAKAQASTGEKTFTLAELAKFNGQNGANAYVAVDGVVYDVTNAWGGGSHNGVTAGQDLSKQINQSPHGKQILSKVPIVGKLK